MGKNIITWWNPNTWGRKIKHVVYDWFLDHPVGYECWSLDYTLSKYIYKRLLVYYRDDKGIHEITPEARSDLFKLIMFFKEYSKHGPEGKEHDELMDKMIFEKSSKSFIGKQVGGPSWDEVADAQKRFNKRREEAFQLLGKYFPSLWV